MAKGRTPAPRSIGAAVRDARVAAHMTQAELASALGVSQNIVGRLEAGGRSDPRLSTLTRVCEVLGVSLDELLASTGLVRRLSPTALAARGAKLLGYVREARKALGELDAALALLEGDIATRPKRRG